MMMGVSPMKRMMDCLNFCGCVGEGRECEGEGIIFSAASIVRRRAGVPVCRLLVEVACALSPPLTHAHTSSSRTTTSVTTTTTCWLSADHNACDNALRKGKIDAQTAAKQNNQHDDDVLWRLLSRPRTHARDDSIFSRRRGD